MKVVTVRGEISPDQLGRTLPHEHLLIDLRCAYREPEEASKKSNRKKFHRYIKLVRPKKRPIYQ